MNHAIWPRGLTLVNRVGCVALLLRDPFRKTGAPQDVMTLSAVFSPITGEPVFSRAANTIPEIPVVR
jgi:hypothetical protein